MLVKIMPFTPLTSTTQNLGFSSLNPTITASKFRAYSVAVTVAVTVAVAVAVTVAVTVVVPVAVPVTVARAVARARGQSGSN